MWTPETLAIIIVTFILAGFVKGVTGLGLPTVALALLTALLGLSQAMVLMLAPSLITNIWQAFAGKALVEIIRRQWLLLSLGSAATIITASFLSSLDTSILAALLGVVLCLYAGISLLLPQVKPPGRNETWLSPLIGLTTGILTGLTGTFVVPSVLYFQSLGLSRNVLIQTMGIWFFIATVSLGAGLKNNGFMSQELAQLSFLAVIPALLGMWLGQQVRAKIPEQKFRTIFFTTLLALGIYIIIRAVN